MQRLWVPNRRQRARLAVVGVLWGVAWLALLAVAGNLQILRAGHYQKIVRIQQWETVEVPARRGCIYGRHGVLLASSGGRSDYRERVYPLGASACHVVGFVGVDCQGLAGVEYALDTVLCARPGEQVVFRDGRRHRRLFTGDVLRPPVHGANAYLTIDAVYQSILAQELEEGMRSTDSEAAWAIMMEPGTGDILAMVSLPGYDPAAPLTPAGRYSRAPAYYVNRAVSCAFEPGSCFKVVTAAAALETGMAEPGTIIDCENGSYVIGGRTVHDVHPHAELTFAEVLAYSSNIGMAHVAELLGAQKLFGFVRAFGFGCRTGLGLAGESPGVLRPLSDWSGYSLVSIAFGQEIAVTAVQLAQALSVVANGGVLMQPRLVCKITSDSGKVIRSSEPTVVRRVISPATCVTLAKLLTGVVEMGTGRRAAVRGVSVAGKTGTAQRFENGEPVGHVSTFMGFAPAERPVFVLVVALQDPHPENLGGVVCGPIFRNVVTRMLASRGGCLFRPLAEAALRGRRSEGRSVAQIDDPVTGPAVG